jgi:protein-tyrosine-phosphatase
MKQKMGRGEMEKRMFHGTGNSCRTKMAEGFAREYGKGIGQKECLFF